MPARKPTAKTTRRSTARKTTARKTTAQKKTARKPAALSKQQYADLRKAANKLELEAGRMAGRMSLQLEKVAADLDKSYQKSDAAKVVKQLEKQLNAWGRVAEQELKKVEKALQAEFANVAKGFNEAKAEVEKSAAKPAAKKPATRRKTPAKAAAKSTSKSTRAKPRTRRAPAKRASA